MDNKLQDPNLREFLKFCRSKIGYKGIAKVRLFDDHEVAKQMKSMAAFFPKTDEIWVLRGQRVRADWYRSLAHELVHLRQRENDVAMDGTDGSDIENEANSLAAVILREFGRKDPEIYEVPSLNEGMNIHSTRKMIDNGMLEFDKDNVSTWPDYYKKIKWIRMDLDVVVDAIEEKNYERALDNMDQIELNFSLLRKGLLQALEEKAKDSEVTDEGVSKYLTEGYYEKMDIATVADAVNRGMLKFDPNNYDTFPTYLKLLSWMKDSSKEVFSKIEDLDFEKALYYAREVETLAQDLVKGLEEAVRDTEGPSTETSDQGGTP